MATQVTTYQTASSPAHVNMKVYEAVVEYQKRGFLLMSTSPNLKARGDFYVMWHPDSYATVEIYEDGM